MSATVNWLFVALLVWSLFSGAIAGFGLMAYRYFRSRPSNFRSAILTASLIAILLLPFSLFVQPFYFLPGYQSALDTLRDNWNPYKQPLQVLDTPPSNGSNPTVKETNAEKNFQITATANRPTPTVETKLDRTVTDKKLTNEPFPPNQRPNLERWTQKIVLLTQFLLLVMWGGGVLYFFYQWFQSWIHTRRILSKATTVNDPLVLDAIERIRQLLFLNARIQIKHAPLKIAPFVSGIKTPTLFIPSDFIASSINLDFRAIVTHELVHLLRNDLWIHYIMRSIYILLWFLPPIDRLRKELIESQDCACDEFAAVVLGSGIEYGEALTRYAERCLRFEQSPIGFARGYNSLLDRLSNVTQFSFHQLKRVSHRFRLILLIYIFFPLTLAGLVGHTLGLTIIQVEEKPISSNPVSTNISEESPKNTYSPDERIEPEIPKSLPFQFSADESMAIEYPNLTCMKMSDLNGDNYPDLVLGSDAGQSQAIFFNQQGESFSAPAFFGSKRDKVYSLDICDVDRDRDIDIITGCYYKPNQVYCNDGQGAFTQNSTFGKENAYVRYVFTGDLNGDLYPDAVIINDATPHSIYWNDGQGRFTTNLDFDVGGIEGDYPICFSTSLLDIDRDGDLDLLFQLPTCHYYLLLENDSEGRFTPRKLKYYSNIAHFLSNPLTKEFLLILSTPNRIDMVSYLNSQLSLFSSISTPALSIKLKLIDMDGDGNSDLVTANRYTQNQIYLNNGNGYYTKRVPFPNRGGNPIVLEVVDFDVDGDLDIVIADEDNSVNFYRNTTPPQIIAVDPPAFSNSVHDPTITVQFDRRIQEKVLSTFAVEGSQSGKRNVRAKSLDNGIVQLIPDNPFFPGETVQVTIPRDTQNPNNGFNSNPYTWIFHQSVDKNDPKFTDITPISFGRDTNHFHYASLGDLDRDGYLDIVAGSVTDGNWIFFNRDQCRRFESVLLDASQNSTFDIKLGDMDGDGDLDIVMSKDSGISSQVLFNDGTGHFPIATDFNTDTNGQKKLLLGDVNLDGMMDIILFNLSYNQYAENRGYWVYLNEGEHRFRANTSKVILSTILNDASLTDVDSDGDFDLITGIKEYGFNACYFNDGLGNFSNSVKQITDGTIDRIQSGDLDNDGDVDLVLNDCTYASNKSVVKILLNQGNGNFTNPQNIALSGFPSDIATGDIDGDGDLDILMSINEAPQIRMLKNDGSAHFDSIDLIQGRKFLYSVLSLGDMDRDGDLDIVEVDSGLTSLVHFNGSTRN